jgi:hypothetical protein
MYSYYQFQIDVEEIFQKTLHNVESTLLSWTTLNITSPPILSLTTFELQCNTFKCTMKANATFAIEPLILLNTFIHLWKTFWTSKVLQSSLSKYLELAKIVVVRVLKSVENKHTISTLSFMKS